MILSVQLFVLALSVLFAGSALGRPAKPIFPYPLRTEVFKIGLTVIRVPFNSPGLVAYYSVVRVGSRNEVEADHTGFAHFFEHVMFKGTKKWAKPVWSTSTSLRAPTRTTE